MSKGSAVGAGRGTPLSRAEVAAMFGVSTSTISRWGREGKLPCVLTLGGQRRYFRDDVLPLIAGAHRKGTPEPIAEGGPVVGAVRSGRRSGD